MPYKRRARKVKRKAKKQGKGKMTVYATKSLGPLPSRYITKHKYSDTFVLNAVNNYQYLFNLNSLFDPNRTGIGHQPYGYDQLAGLYNRYRVIRTSYVISGIQADSPGTNVRIGAQPANDIILYGNLSAMCEAPRSKFIVQGAQGSPLKTLKGFSHIPSLMGRTRPEYMADDRYSAAVGSSPAEFAILNVMGATLGDAGVTINAVITMEFTVEWFDIAQQTQS